MIENIRAELKARFVERDDVIDGALTAFLCREHVLILGPPGTAKSMLAQEICRRFGGLRYFRWLLTKFTTPEELFGPVSLKGLENDRYVRVTAGKLPEANVAFLDEVFLANSSILNTLLTLINERKFFNGDQAVDVPLITLFASCSEPPKSKELGAFYDRFLFRFQVGYAREDRNFKRILTLEENADSVPIMKPSPPPSPPVRSATADGRAGPFQSATGGEGVLRRPAEEGQGEEIRAWAQGAWDRLLGVTVPESMLDLLASLRKRLNGLGIVASDRRYKRSLGALRAHARIHGRDAATPRDMEILKTILWTTPEEAEKVADAIDEVVFPSQHRAQRCLDQVTELKRDLEETYYSDEERAAVAREALHKVEKLSQRIRDLAAADRSSAPESGVKTVVAHFHDVAETVRALCKQFPPPHSAQAG
ncbi:MAG: AAA family ATPase [Nitrospirae bacterium]|nr:AAA family ATPase [Nitrospirota bacterium]